MATNFPAGRQAMGRNGQGTYTQALSFLLLHVSALWYYLRLHDIVAATLEAKNSLTVAHDVGTFIIAG